MARLELFGSATSDRFNDTASDIDFLVEFAINTPQGASDRFFGLKQGLSDRWDTPSIWLRFKPLKIPTF